MTDLELQAAKVKESSGALRKAGTAVKNDALRRIAEALKSRSGEWLKANEIDLENAAASGMSAAMLDRLRLTKERVDDIARGVLDVAALPDPVAKSDHTVIRPNGLIIEKRRVPLGVIAIIFESRPNVTVDAASLCLKSGNACLLRGGKEAIHSNLKAGEIMRDAVTEAGLPRDVISLVKDTGRESANELMHLNKYIDVLIPRGGAGLIRSVADNASVPVIRTGEGVCHVYVDKDADLDMGARVLFNGKCSRPSVCNAVECALIHESVLEAFLIKAVPLLAEKNVEFRCDETSLDIVKKIRGGAYADAGLVKAAESPDWDAEYDDYILAIKTVKDLDEALSFISEHGTGHSEAIITENYPASQRFLNEVDAAAVYVNASTRFTDGGEFGLGAEIGISTQKLHARGPMGLEELTSYKYLIYGNGQIR